MSRLLAPWKLILAVGVALVAVVTFTSSFTLEAVVALSAAVLSTIAVVVGIVVRRPARRDAWLLVAIGLGGSVLGLLTWREDTGVAAAGGGFEVTLSEGILLACYATWGVAAWRMARRGDRDDRPALIDAGIIGIAGAMLIWLFLLNPYLGLAELTPAQRFTAIAFPMADMLLLPLLGRLVFARGTRIASHLLLLAGLGTLLAGDLLFGLGRLHGWYQPSGPLDAIYLVSFASVAAAVWHPSAQWEPPPAPDVANLSSRRLFALACAAITTPAVLLLQPNPGAATVRVTAVATIVVFLLVLLRMAGLVRRVDEQTTQLERLSRTDPLTGVSNRRVLDESLAQALARLERHDEPFAFGMLDLDHFKRFNDTYGHPAGDDLLVELTARWRRELREVDLLARYGGEEFAVLLPGCGRETAVRVFERLRGVVPAGQTCSAGVVVVSACERPADLIGEADRALYAAKRAGRDRVVVADSEAAR